MITVIETAVSTEIIDLTLEMFDTFRPILTISFFFSTTLLVIRTIFNVFSSSGYSPSITIHESGAVNESVNPIEHSDNVENENVVKMVSPNHIMACNCPNCGAPLNPLQAQCKYCDSYIL